MSVCGLATCTESAHSPSIPHSSRSLQKGELEMRKIDVCLCLILPNPSKHTIKTNAKSESSLVRVSSSDEI